MSEEVRGAGSIESWQRRLRIDRSGCNDAAQSKCRALREGGVCQYDVARYFAQMMNGCATPADFDISVRA